MGAVDLAKAGVTAACWGGNHDSCSKPCGCRCHRPRPALPPFSGDGPTCAKCGHVGARTQFLAYGECIHGPTLVTNGWHPNERLHRECQRCDYQWDEATVE